MGKYVVIDLEMCRVPKRVKEQCSIRMETIQIGAVLLNESYEMIDKFNVYVAPEYGCIDTFINRLTGIDRSDLKDAPKLQDAIRRFMDWLPDDDVRMVSWSDSDKCQIRQETAEKGIAVEGLDLLMESWIDCQKIFGEKMKTNRCYGLNEALIAADILGEGREHDGLADAYNTALLFQKLETEAELKLNPIYEAARQEEVSHLQFSMGELFAGLKLQTGKRVDRGVVVSQE